MAELHTTTDDAGLLAASAAGDRELVEQLPAVQREALLARVIAEQGYGEIALDVGASEAAVRQRVSRALAWLRTRTGQEQT